MKFIKAQTAAAVRKGGEKYIYIEEGAIKAICEVTVPKSRPKVWEVITDPSLKTVTGYIDQAGFDKIFGTNK